MLAWLSSSAVTVLLAGSGAESADLSAVERVGGVRTATVDLVVNDGVPASCNGGEGIALPGDGLLEAREFARDLEQQAALSLELPRGPGSTLRYVVRTSTGRVSFFDPSPDRPRVFDELVRFSKDVIEDVCKIER